jgi:hypothetical protein
MSNHMHVSAMQRNNRLVDLLELDLAARVLVDVDTRRTRTQACNTYKMRSEWGGMRPGNSWLP